MSTGKTHTIPPDLALPFGTWPAGIVSFSVCLFLPIHTLANSVISAATVIIKKAFKWGNVNPQLQLPNCNNFSVYRIFSLFLLHLWPFLNFFSFLIFSFFDSNQVTETPVMSFHVTRLGCRGKPSRTLKDSGLYAGVLSIVGK